MTFEEKFPSLKGRVGLQERQVYDESDSSLNQASSDYSQVFEIVDVEDIEKHCLDKQKFIDFLNDLLIKRQISAPTYDILKEGLYE